MMTLISETGKRVCFLRRQDLFIRIHHGIARSPSIVQDVPDRCEGKQEKED